MAKDRILRLILGDQLNAKHTWFQKSDQTVTYVLMEIRQETDYVKHHVQKVVAFFAAMRAFAEKLKEKGHTVIYLRLDDANNQQTIEGNIKLLLKEKRFTHFEYLLPEPKRYPSLGRRLTPSIFSRGDRICRIYLSAKSAI
jgi:deoxyribodipyrimidine photolyase-related protein